MTEDAKVEVVKFMPEGKSRIKRRQREGEKGQDPTDRCSTDKTWLSTSKVANTNRSLKVGSWGDKGQGCSRDVTSWMCKTMLLRGGNKNNQNCGCKM
jgi:hypothetical protein